MQWQRSQSGGPVTNLSDSAALIKQHTLQTKLFGPHLQAMFRWRLPGWRFELPQCSSGVWAHLPQLISSQLFCSASEGESSARTLYCASKWTVNGGNASLLGKNNALNRCRREGALAPPPTPDLPPATRVASVWREASTTQIAEIYLRRAARSAPSESTMAPFYTTARKETALFFSRYSPLFPANCFRYHWGEKTVE